MASDRHRPAAAGQRDTILFVSSLGDLAALCFLGAYVALTVGLLRLVRARSRGRDVPAVLDALVVTIGLGVVSWQFLMVPYARDPSLTLEQKLTSVLLPLADVVLLAVLVRLLSGGGRRPAAYWLLGLSVVALLAADSAFGVITIYGPCLPGSPLDALFIAFPLVGGAAFLAPGVQMVEWLRGQSIEVPVVAAGSIVMFLLIVARTQGLTREVTVQDERRRLLGRAGSEAVMGELQSTDEVLEGVEKGLGEETKVLRHLMSALRPPVLDNRGFAEALDEHVQRFEQEHATAVEVTLGLDGRLTPELETILYRIVQESLTNMAKHARAGRVSVTVDQLADGTVRLRVRDDGVGFDTGNSARLLREGHFGLAGMRERASLVGGAVEVRSVPGEGTTVEARLPAQLLPLEPAPAP